MIDLHHDASFYEEARDVWNACQPDIATFEREFPLRGRLTIEHLFEPHEQALADMLEKEV